MVIRPFEIETDFEHIRKWINDERTHAMWCANLIPYPLDKDVFQNFLLEIADRFGDIPFVAVDDTGKVIGFFSYSLNQDSKEGMLKFVVVDSAERGKGIGKEMLRLAIQNAFSDPDVKAVQLNVFPENSRAKRCYEGTGFKVRRTDHNVFLYKDEAWSRCNMVMARY